MRSRNCKVSRALGTAAAAVVLFILAVCADGLLFLSKSAYQGGDAGKAGLYAGRNVLVLVPNQDDETIFLAAYWKNTPVTAAKCALCL